MSDLQTLLLASLVPHPGNPRLQPREDVVERIAAEIGRSGFGDEHALLVRPKDGAYQIISGHHRREAAQRAGLTEVPCWVRDLGDREAFMQLVLANTQGELSPLEIGMHALAAIPLGKRGRGNSGDGLTAYAEQIGRTQGYVSQLHAAASVMAEIHNSSNEFSPADLLDKAKHLYEISKAPRESWMLLVDRLLAKRWSVSDTIGQADKVRKFSIPPEHTRWLPFGAVVEAYLRSDRLNPAAVAKLIATAEGVLAYIAQEGTGEDREAFTAWLQDNAGNDSWDARRIGRYHADLIREVAARRAAEAEAAAEDDEPSLPEGVDLRAGDFREVLKDLDGTVDAIITDPPYPEEFLPLFADLSRVAARILKPGGICAVMVGQSYLPQIFAALGQHLTWHWLISYETPGGQAVQLWQRKVNTFWKPVLVYVKGTYGGDWFGDVARSAVNDNDKQHHHWGQSESGMADLIERLTKPGQLICDPFLGGGTTGVVAHDLARRFVGCDLDESCVTTTASRFAVAESTA
jgi:site-specific DNA-methyltransferase (adenine-specific)